MSEVVDHDVIGNDPVGCREIEVQERAASAFNRFGRERRQTDDVGLELVHLLVERLADLRHARLSSLRRV